VFVVSNQSVIARGWATHEQVHDVNDRIQALLGEASGAHVDAFYYCPHHPDITGPCECRKPAPGMLLQAAREHGIDLKRSYMVGDTATDIEAGINAGTRTVLLLTSGIGARSELEAMGKWPTAIMDGVGEAVEWALRDIERRAKKGKGGKKKKESPG
jgi:D-glycero-D-manno-heptose 1,7-bisphosphate phosphatase